MQHTIHELIEEATLELVIEEVKLRLIELQKQCSKLGLNISIANVDLQITNLIKLKVSICYVRHWIDYRFTYNNDEVRLTHFVEDNIWHIKLTD